MTAKFETRLAELGVTLADAPAPAANYVPFVQVGDLVFVPVKSAKMPMALSPASWETR